MRIFLYFARAYPWQSLIVLLCLLLTAVVETPALVGVADRIYRIANQTARRVNVFEPAAASAEAVA
jgi:hypothetical protein